jgi:hypothetical protein
MPRRRTEASQPFAWRGVGGGLVMVARLRGRARKRRLTCSADRQNDRGIALLWLGDDQRIRELEERASKSALQGARLRWWRSHSPG